MPRPPPRLVDLHKEVVVHIATVLRQTWGQRGYVTDLLMLCRFGLERMGCVINYRNTWLNKPWAARFFRTQQDAGTGHLLTIYQQIWQFTLLFCYNRKPRNQELMCSLHLDCPSVTHCDLVRASS